MFWRKTKTVFIRNKGSSEGRVMPCWYEGELLVCQRLIVDHYGDMRNGSGQMVLDPSGQILGDDKLHWTPASGFKLIEN